MANEFTPILNRLPHSIHRIDPTVTILRKYKLLLWSATVILVRHAERAAGANPALSATGQARANLLRDMVQDEDLSAVFVTDTLRSQQTGQPAANAQGLAPTTYPATDGAALAQTIRIGHAGRTVLVVAHSNTVDDIAGALGAPGIGELADSQFDRMFVIARNWCGTRLTRLRYGAPTA
ncbi:phosphoglycerate mutase family protein [Mesorhizobium onobrychidis]|uniref:Histidine phosphatase family protein n=1 Tax=Mesorhizobium onobrychidis TaxID=2775404 RepID=A0ABY5R9F7_9HYPH|nr:phosphoglycerate mutase family protein [Mesorhizobium onobrychidis]UVC19419.1 histidine phosphatase family protein [Mesorhizobium onobrychidis]